MSETTRTPTPDDIRAFLGVNTALAKFEGKQRIEGRSAFPEGFEPAPGVRVVYEWLQRCSAGEEAIPDADGAPAAASTVPLELVQAMQKANADLTELRYLLWLLTSRHPGGQVMIPAQAVNENPPGFCQLTIDHMIVHGVIMLRAIRLPDPPPAPAPAQTEDDAVAANDAAADRDAQQAERPSR